MYYRQLNHRGLPTVPKASKPSRLTSILQVTGYILGAMLLVLLTLAIAGAMIAFLVWCASTAYHRTL